MTDRQGWICPRCDRVHSPDRLGCDCVQTDVYTCHYNSEDDEIKWTSVYASPTSHQWSMSRDVDRELIREELGNIIREALQGL